MSGFFIGQNKMKLTKQLKSDIISHALDRYPAESCGVVVKTDVDTKGGAVTTIAQGNPNPLLYGEYNIGGFILSASQLPEDML